MKAERIFPKIFSKKCHTAVDGHPGGFYNAAHRTRAVLLLAALALVQAFLEELVRIWPDVIGFGFAGLGLDGLSVGYLTIE